MANTIRSLKVQPSLQQLLHEWFRPLANRMNMLNETILPFQRRAIHPLSFEAWRKAYEHLSVLLHEAALASDHPLDLWYCVMEAGLVDFSKMSFTKEEALVCADQFESAFDLMTRHSSGQWLSLMFDEVAFVYRDTIPYADRVRDRFDLAPLVRHLEQVVVNFNVLVSCFEHVQQRKEGQKTTDLIITSYSVPALSLIFNKQGSEEDNAYQLALIERIRRECEVQIG